MCPWNETTEVALSGVLSRLVSAANLLMATTVDLGRASDQAKWERLQRVAGSIVAHLNLDEALKELAGAALDLLEASRTTVWLYHEEDGALERKALASQHSPPAVAALGDRVSLEESANSLVFRTHAGLFIGDVSSDPRLEAGWRERLLGSGFLSIYLSPLALEGRILGTLAVGYDGRRDNWAPFQRGGARAASHHREPRHGVVPCGWHVTGGAGGASGPGSVRGQGEQGRRVTLTGW